MNAAEHSTNAIHTDAGARAAGFPGALVAGVTTYAYLTHPVVAAWGLDWVAHGGAEVRFDRPMFDGEDVVCSPIADGDEAVVTAIVAGDPRATLRATRHGGSAPSRRDGATLKPCQVPLSGRYGSDYGMRIGDDLDAYLREGVVHPAVWPAIANTVFSEQLVSGSWIHLRSSIRHHGLARAGATADVHAVVVDRSTRRSGERAVADVVIEVDGRLVATLEHEAIIALPGA